jgi:hypothetical protein
MGARWEAHRLKADDGVNATRSPCNLATTVATALPLQQLSKSGKGVWGSPLSIRFSPQLCDNMERKSTNPQEKTNYSQKFLHFISIFGIM